MELTCIVVDKDGNVLSDEDLKNKVITCQRYYDVMLPIRKRINEEIFDKRKAEKSSWNNLLNLL